MTAYQTDKTTLNYYACSADLMRLKRENDWLREPDRFALQSALRDLDDAYRRILRVYHLHGCSAGILRLKSWEVQSSAEDVGYLHTTTHIGRNYRALLSKATLHGF